MPAHVSMHLMAPPCIFLSLLKVVINDVIVLFVLHSNTGVVRRRCTSHRRPIECIHGPTHITLVLVLVVDISLLIKEYSCPLPFVVLLFFLLVLKEL